MNQLKYLLFWLSAIVLSVTSAYGQYSISGIVTDQGTGEPLAGANVVVENSKKASFTDENGRFEVKDLKPAFYTVRVSYVGYETATRDVQLEDDATLIFQMTKLDIITDQVTVSATRATEETPTTYTEIDREEIADKNFGQDLPYIMQQEPSVVVTSDAGAGVGYTSMRIRGSDQSRINVTINGIPVNDAESQGVFYVDLPDFASSVENIQIQRGVGTSTNGAGAFGGTVNFQTLAVNPEPYVELDNSYGSFNTHKHTLKLGTGLLDDKFSFDGRISKINSEGYLDRAYSDLFSLYLSGAYKSKNTLLKAIAFSGKEETYQAWWGVPEPRLTGDVEGMSFYADQLWLTDEQRANLLTSGRSYNYYLYENELDNYQQDYYQLHLSQALHEQLVFNAALHLTYGRGYFEQFRNDDALSFYGLDDVIVGNDTITTTDLIRRRWLDNYFYGATYSFNYYPGNQWKIILGGAWNQYDGDHFGEIIWARFASNGSIRERYYDNNALKTDFNSYLKVTYDVLDNLSLFGDIQYRNVGYTAYGPDNDGLLIDIDEDFNFVNPKAGLTFDINNINTVYASFAVANREPTRADFTDALPGEKPKHETLRNLEVGYRYHNRGYRASANFYYMDYTDQLVLTGELNDVGSPIRRNVDDSYRSGIELLGSIQPVNFFRWSGNFTYSMNKINQFNEVIYLYKADWSTEVVTNEHTGTDISFSPSVIAASNITLQPLKWMELSFISKYVGEQYLDNTSNESRKIDAYFVNDVKLQLTFKQKFFKEIAISLLVNNVFDTEYESNGYTFGWLVEDTGGPQRLDFNYYYPQAGINYLANLSLKF